MKPLAKTQNRHSGDQQDLPNTVAMNVVESTLLDLLDQRCHDIAILLSLLGACGWYVRTLRLELHGAVNVCAT